MENIVEFLSDEYGIELEDTIEYSTPSSKLTEIDLEDLPDKISLWLQEKHFIRPSADLTVFKSLEPGEYTVHYSNDLGYYCQKIKGNYDELIVFSETITPVLLNEIKLFWEKKDLFEQHKLIHKRGILLEGYSGTGKTSIINQLSQQLIDQGGVVFKIQNFKNLDDYVGFMHLGFRKIQPDTPVITILEDIDQYGNVEAELLDFLDGKMSINHHLIIATSNNTEDIPDTFLRPSRIDLRFEVPFPSAKTREEYFKAKKVSDSYLKELVDKTENCSLAELKEIYICLNFLDYSLEDAVKKVKHPLERKNYLFNSFKNDKIGL